MSQIGDEGAIFSFPVTMTNTNGATMTVDWTASPTPDDADYTGGSGILTFDGDGTQNVQIQTHDDPAEGVETGAQTFTFTVKLVG